MKIVIPNIWQGVWLAVPLIAMTSIPTDLEARAGNVCKELCTAGVRNVVKPVQNAGAAKAANQVVPKTTPPAAPTQAQDAVQSRLRKNAAEDSVRSNIRNTKTSGPGTNSGTVANLKKGPELPSGQAKREQGAAIHKAEQQAAVTKKKKDSSSSGTGNSSDSGTNKKPDLKNLRFAKPPEPNIKNPIIVERWGGLSENFTTRTTGLLRGGQDNIRRYGRNPNHHVTPRANSDPKRATQRLSLEKTPQFRMRLEIENNGTFSKPSKVEQATYKNKPGNGTAPGQSTHYTTPGGGTERIGQGDVPARILKEWHRP